MEKQTENKPLVPVNEKPTLCIIGDPGAGKTRLAALYPDSFFLDAEGGAASAVPPSRRMSFEIDKSLLVNLKGKIENLKKCAYKDKRYKLDGVDVGAIVIDSLDAVQQVYKYEGLLKEKQWKEPRQMWGKLLDDMIPLVYVTRQLKVPTIWIAHSKVEEPVYNFDTMRKPGWRGIAAQGALEDQIVRWFDYILHLFIEEDYTRKCITQPTVYKDYRIVAKDRHNTFKNVGKMFTIKANEDGYPDSQAMQVIYERHVY